MGFLDVHTPIPFNEARKYHEHIKAAAAEQLINNWKRTKDWKKPMNELHWGDEMEYMLVSMPPDRPPKPYYYADKVLEKLHEEDTETWKPEYASYMVEGVKVPPLRLTHSDISRETLHSLRSRRRTLSAALPANVHVASIPAFPTLGAQYTHEDDTLEGPTAKSIMVPDIVITPHVRFQTLTKSVRERKGAKVVIAPPLYQDKHTKSIGKLDFSEEKTPWELERLGLDKSRDPLKNRIYLDATVFGFGESCLQVTFEASSLPAARLLHDQMAILSPLFLAVSAAAPFQRGMVSDADVRYNLLTQCVDDRTEEEANPNSDEYKQQGRMPDTIHRYISVCAPEALSDLVVETRPDHKSRLMEAGMDSVMADYFAYILYRDPMIIFKERLELDNTASTEHFEGMHSTHWTIVRIKPPPPVQTDIHWRVELRTPDVQLTDYENAALITVATLLARAILRRADGPDCCGGGQVCRLIPISKLRMNTLRTQKNDALRHGTFWWNKDGNIEELSMEEIWCAPGGLLDVCRSELVKGMGEAAAASLDSELINFIEARVKGKVISGAQFLRQRLYRSPNYHQDSIITPEAAREILDLSIKLGQAETYDELKRLAPEMFSY